MKAQAGPVHGKTADGNVPNGKTADINVPDGKTVHVIRIKDSALFCEAGEGESILLSCARGGIILSAPCGARNRCGKCKVKILEGQVSGDLPDAESFVRACIAVPLTDIVIAAPEVNAIAINEVYAKDASSIETARSEAENEELPPFLKKSPLRTGVAMDIGTTTVSAKLIDLDSSAPLDIISELNDQRAFGADVMSRIGAAREGKTEELFSAINMQAAGILRSFIERRKLSHIDKLTVSGNTTMLHLFLNVNPGGMGELPFTPAFLEGRELRGEELSLPAGMVTVLPSISAFVGGDISSGLAALDILKMEGPSLLVDIGTNGEMALFNKGSILCCSTAAGPCFEGAEISCGLGGVSGAISRVELSGEGPAKTVSIATIGNEAPRGICGSGLIDAVAVMLEQGIVDETGLMENHPSGYTLAPGVSITNKDIRQFQLAKSAILSGIKILCARQGLNLKEIENVFIAGGFGFFINKKNAVAAGLLPAEFLDRITISGNLSLGGAVESLTALDFGSRCREIISACSVIDLSLDPAFMDEFAENMLF